MAKKVLKTAPQLVKVTPTEAGSTLHPYSNSRLVSISTCPIYGVVSNQRAYPSSARAMALECGSAMHEVFAACRVWQLEHHQKLPKHALVSAARLFTPIGEYKDEHARADASIARWKRCVSQTKDRRDNLIELCFNILHSTGYEDEPGDNVRTMSNMEMATINYCDQRLANMDNWPVWVENEKKPYLRTGIELPFDITLHFNDGARVRYIGTIDGLVFDINRDRFTLDENKTASRLDEAWQRSFDMAHQITGYCAASTTVFGFPVLHSRVSGVKIKPSRVGEDIVTIDPIARDAYSINHWALWVRSVAFVFEQYRNDFENAPRYTHSCNRYFRPCSMIPFCTDTPQGRKEQWDDMVEAEKSPSERAVIGD